MSEYEWAQAPCEEDARNFVDMLKQKGFTIDNLTAIRQASTCLGQSRNGILGGVIWKELERATTMGMRKVSRQKRPKLKKSKNAKYPLLSILDGDK